MEKNETLKNLVKDTYGQIAKDQSGCCSTTGCCSDLSLMSESYSDIEGHFAEADLGLGCGIPTEFAGIEPGHSVLDLGSGAGNDCFVARTLTGPEGKVTGIDFTEEMLSKARIHNEKLGYTNVEFIKGDIESIPLEDDSYDVVISNCVINLVPDKDKAFSEIMRVLKPGGRFCISDIVLEGSLPGEVAQAAALYAGCVAGALQKEEYTAKVRQAGFTDISIRKDRQIHLPLTLLARFLNNREIESFASSGTGIFSITMTGVKPLPV